LAHHQGGPAVTPDEFRVAGHELIDWIADYRERLAERRVGPDVAPGEIRAMLPAHPPSSVVEFGDVLADVDEIVLRGTTNWLHPSFFAYFPSNASYASVLGDLLTAGLNVNGMSWVTSPAATEMETLMLDWMGELLDLPPRFASGGDGGGVIQGSASEATLVAILSARWRSTHGAVNADGDTSRLVAYLTAQTHSSIPKGLRVAGIGEDRQRIVDHDEAFAMRPEAFADAVTADLAAGLVPCFVCSTHGTTSSMAFDPTPELAATCARNGIWLHVDAAMSGIGALAPELRWVNAGLEHADSYCTNAHKWMGVNFDCDLYWTVDRAALLGALSILPEYLRSSAAASGAAIDYRDWQIPLGRRFRALKLWFALRLDGVDDTISMVRDHVGWTQWLADEARRDERFEVVAPHPLNMVCLRLHAGDSATDALIEAANATGEALFTRTVLDGRTALRFSIGTATTTRHHVDAAWRLLQQLAT